MFAFQPLLAVDWIQVIIVLFIMGGSAIGQLYKAAQNRNQKAKRKRAQFEIPPVAQQQGQHPGAGAAAEQAERPKTSLEKEIEAFLRRKLGGQKAAEQKAIPPRVPKRPDRQLVQRRSAQRRSVQPKRLPLTPPSAGDSGFPPSESVGQHVDRHIHSDDLVERDAHLGDALEQTDERMESHLRDVFQHRLGSLERSSFGRESTIAEGTDAFDWDKRDDGNPLHEELFEMLSSPLRVQTAMILSEIMRRPDDPWS